MRQISWLLLASWLIPLGVSLSPWAGATTLSEHLLPMFWATFVAVYLYGAGLGLIVGLFAPLLTLVIVGVRAYSWMALAGFELVVFVAAAWGMARARRGFWLNAPLAYVVARACSTALEAVAPALGQGQAPVPMFLHALQVGLPGLAILTLINVVLARNAGGR